jgi:hypothetical protein
MYDFFAESQSIQLLCAFDTPSTVMQRISGAKPG